LDGTVVSGISGNFRIPDLKAKLPKNEPCYAALYESAEKTILVFWSPDDAPGEGGKL
jgi:hypothetical protein